MKRKIKPPRWRALRIVRLARKLWWSSLPLRVLISTLGLSILVLSVVGLLFVRLVTNGLIDAKRETSIDEVAVIHERMQQQILDASTDQSLGETLGQVSNLAGVARYEMILQGPGLNMVTKIKPDVITEELRQQVEDNPGMFITLSEIEYYDETRSAEPGVVIGTTLVDLMAERHPVYYIFPMTVEVRMLRLLQTAVLVAGIGLVVALGFISYLTTARIVRPVRRASVAALRLASGHLDERIRVRGTDDLASLARSMNQMAGQLQQRIRELERLSNLQQRFVSDVSHELRTPLTTIKLASERLYDVREDFDSNSVRYVELMNSELERFDRMLADLLEISRFDAGAAVLALDEVDVAELTSDEIALVRPMASRMGIELQLRLPTERTTAQLDARRVRRIVRNLLTNAIEHASGQPVTVTVAANSYAVAISVRDYGIGFSVKDAQRVFDRFWRADPSRNRLIGGSGLGLSIALEDARLHHGWLNAWGCPGEGAQFRLTLPRSQHHGLTGSPLPLIPPDATEDAQVKA